RARYCLPGDLIAGGVVREGAARARHLEVGRRRRRGGCFLLSAARRPRATLFPYTTLFRSHGIVEGITGIGALAQHHPCLGPGVRVGLRDDTGADPAIATERLPDVVELIGGAPDVPARALHRPGAPAQRLAPRQRGGPDVGA